MIYPSEPNHIHQEIYEDLRVKAGKLEDEVKETVSIWKSFSHEDFRKASWIVIYIMVAFNLSGIPVINIYTNVIFEKIKKAGGISALSPEQ